MAKYLLNSQGHEENSFFGFESDESIENLKRELAKVLSKTDYHDVFVFRGFRDYKSDMCRRRIITLEQFWNEVSEPIQ